MLCLICLSVSPPLSICVSFRCCCCCLLVSLESANDSMKVSLLREAFGSAAVSAPTLGTRRTLMAFALGFAITALLMCAIVVMTFLKSNVAAGIMALVSLSLMSLLAFFLAWRGVTQLVMRQAVLQAEINFKEFQPNVIVAPAYGAVVALQMDVPKVPLVSGWMTETERRDRQREETDREKRQTERRDRQREETDRERERNKAAEGSSLISCILHSLSLPACEGDRATGR